MAFFRESATSWETLSSMEVMDVPPGQVIIDLFMMPGHVQHLRQGSELRHARSRFSAPSSRCLKILLGQGRTSASLNPVHFPSWLRPRHIPHESFMHVRRGIPNLDHGGEGCTRSGWNSDNTSKG